MNTNNPIDELSLLQYSVAGRLPGMATRGTKTPIMTFVLFVTFVPFVVRQHFSPSPTRRVHSWFIFPYGGPRRRSESDGKSRAAVLRSRHGFPCIRSLAASGTVGCCGGGRRGSAGPVRGSARAQFRGGGHLREDPRKGILRSRPQPGTEPDHLRHRPGASQPARQSGVLLRLLSHPTHPSRQGKRDRPLRGLQSRPQGDAGHVQPGDFVSGTGHPDGVRRRAACWTTASAWPGWAGSSTCPGLPTV